MADSVSVEHEGVTITTNTASEADLRTEMTTPEASAPPAAESEAAAAARARDEKGRFAKAETVPAGSETAAAGSETKPAGSETAAAGSETAPARRRDDTLPRHNPIARLNQALAQKAEAERRAAALEAELARTRQSGVTSPVTPSPASSPAPTNGHYGPPEPQFDQFADAPDPYTAYVQAWTRWDRAQALAQARHEWDTEQTAKQRASEFTTRLQTGKTQFPDFDEALTQADKMHLQVSAVMQDAIAESPQAADLVYYLATHPEECTQLAEESQYTPVAAASVMRRLLESRLSPRAAASAPSPGAAATGSVSTAKPPVTPVGSSPVVSDEPPGDAASAAEHARYWNRRLKVPGTK